MSDLPDSASAKPTAADAFFADVLRRIRLIAIAIAIVATAAIWLIYGMGIGLGFLAGCAISYLNFVWLERVINAVADRVTQTGEAGRSRPIVIRFLLRYGFIAIACFVILICFKSSVYGLLGGLFLTVAAILCEAAYEGVVALRRGF
jgi:hypothetical protein